MTAWARPARGNSEQSCGNAGAMESQHRAFHSSGDGLFYWNEKGIKKESKRNQKGKKPKAVYTKVFTPP